MSVCSAHCHCYSLAESPSAVPIVLAELSLFDEDKGRFRPHLTLFEQNLQPDFIGCSWIPYQESKNS